MEVVLEKVDRRAEKSREEEMKQEYHTVKN